LLESEGFHLKWAIITNRFIHGFDKLLINERSFTGIHKRDYITPTYIELTTGNISGIGHAIFFP